MDSFYVNFTNMTFQKEPLLNRGLNKGGAIAPQYFARIEGAAGHALLLAPSSFSKLLRPLLKITFQCLLTLKQSFV